MSDHDELCRRGVAGLCRAVATMTVLTGCLLVGAAPSLAVTINAPTTFAAADAADGTVDGIFTVPGDLTIATGGSITCNDPQSPPSASACKIKIAVSGNMVMEPGSAILAQNTVESGNGGRIKVVVRGDLTLRGTNGATPGAKISSSDKTAGGTVGTAGQITIKVGKPSALPPTGDLVVEAGAKFLPTARIRVAGRL